jgi:hypothetical protein
MMIHDQPKLGQLIKEYGQLRTLPAEEASKRGQRFNHFLAEIMQTKALRNDSRASRPEINLVYPNNESIVSAANPRSSSIM